MNNDPLLGSMQWTIARNLVKWAAGQTMFCPHCDRVLDCSRTIVASDGGRATITLCADCWGKAPGNFKSGSVEVWDGRVLFAKPARTKRTKKGLK